MINWKKAKRFWLKTNPEYLNTPEQIEDAKNFVQKYASKIRWAKSICELGVGDGKHLYYFLEKYPNKKYCGNDFDPKVFNMIAESYPDISDKCFINCESTTKYLKKYLRYSDAIFTYNHLMYVVDEEIDQVCSNISYVTGKYLLIREIFTEVKYKDNNRDAFISFGFGRDYTNMFDDFELKNKDVETININEKEVEFHTYLFKRMG